MRWKLGIFLVLLVSCAAITAQDKPALECPSISVTGPAGIVPPGGLATYTARVEGVDKGAHLRYVWSVSTGTIESGQGTPTVKIRISDDGFCPTATVQIIGLPNGCVAMASETASCDPVPQAEKLGEYAGPIRSIPIKAFKLIGNTARNNPISQIYISVGAGPQAFAGVIRQLVARVSKYQPDESRLTYIHCASTAITIRVWNVPPGADPPTCDKSESRYGWPASQSPDSITYRNPCPAIKINGPAGLTKLGELMTFRSVVSGKFPRNIKYKWEVRPGNIIGGQGTRKIKVRAPTEEGVSIVKAYLQLAGLPDSCNDRANEVAGIAPQLALDPYDKYGDVPLETEKGRLAAAAWAQRSTHHGLRILLIRRVVKIDSRTKSRVGDVKTFMQQTLHLAPPQFRVVVKLGSEIENTIWFVKPTTDIRVLIGVASKSR